jgi:hypothetical protein
MILKRYGSSYHSVEPNFDSKALNEIGFRRDRVMSLAAEELEAAYERGEEHRLEAEADGRVQDATEQVLLDKLEAKLRTVLEELEEGEVLVFENDDGREYPKTRQKTRNVVEEGENVLHFTYTVAPPLRFAVYRPR